MFLKCFWYNFDMWFTYLHSVEWLLLFIAYQVQLVLVFRKSILTFSMSFTLPFPRQYAIFLADSCMVYFYLQFCFVLFFSIDKYIYLLYQFYFFFDFLCPLIVERKIYFIIMTYKFCRYRTRDVFKIFFSYKEQLQLKKELLILKYKLKKISLRKG